MNSDVSVVDLYYKRYVTAGIREWWKTNKNRLKLNDLNKEILKSLLAAGITVSVIAGAVGVKPIIIQRILGQERLVPELRTAPNAEVSVTATVYQVSPRQTLGNPQETADGTILIPETGLFESGEKVIALSRNLLSRWGGPYEYKDRVQVTGAGEMDGIWAVHDVLDERFFNYADFLVPLRGNVRAKGYWNNVTIKKVY